MHIYKTTMYTHLAIVCWPWNPIRNIAHCSAWTHRHINDKFWHMTISATRSAPDLIKLYMHLQKSYTWDTVRTGHITPKEIDKTYKATLFILTSNTDRHPAFEQVACILNLHKWSCDLYYIAFILYLVNDKIFSL